MKPLSLVTCLLLASVVAGAQTNLPSAGTSRVNELASPPTLIPFDGELPARPDLVRAGSATIVISIYAAKDDTTPLWSEEQTVPVGADGKYVISIGASREEGVPSDVFAKQHGRWIGIAVKNEVEQPRIMVVSVPYAVKAGDAETIGGRPFTDFVLAAQLRDRIEEALKDVDGAGRAAMHHGEARISTTSIQNVVRRPAPNAVSYEMKTLFPSEGLLIRASQHQLILADSSEADLFTNYWYITRAGADGKVRFRHNNADRVTFDDTGDVGIGTAAPNTALDVVGAISIRTAAAPAAAPSGQGRIYFDSGTNSIRYSQNGGPYRDLDGSDLYYSKSAVDSLLRQGLVGKIVFVTQTAYTGALGTQQTANGGLIGADAKCQAAAKSVGFIGTFQAWLSGNDSSVDASTRMTHSDLAYFTPNGAKIADNWADLVDGLLDHSINVTEQGTVLNGYDVWTGTRSDGTVRDPGSDCGSTNVPGSAWLSSESTDAGGYGLTNSTTGTWTNNNQEPCNFTARLYCVQQ